MAQLRFNTRGVRPLPFHFQRPFKLTIARSYNRACSLDPEADIAYCTEERISGSPGETQSTFYIVTTSNFGDLRTNVTVTAGFEKLQPSPTTSHQTPTHLGTAAGDD
jgi:hypothetical protein